MLVHEFIALNYVDILAVTSCLLSEFLGAVSVETEQYELFALPLAEATRSQTGHERHCMASLKPVLE